MGAVLAHGVHAGPAKIGEGVHPGAIGLALDGHPVGFAVICLVGIPKADVPPPAASARPQSGSPQGPRRVTARQGALICVEGVGALGQAALVVQLLLGAVALVVACPVPVLVLPSLLVISTVCIPLSACMVIVKTQGLACHGSH